VDEYISAFATDFKKLNLHYSQKSCLQFCKQKFTLTKCDCLSAFYPKIITENTTHYCGTRDDILCFQTSQIDFRIDECLDLCPPECESVTYDIFTSTSLFPDPGVGFQALKSNSYVVANFRDENISAEEITYEQIRMSVASVSIFFSDIIYTRIEEYPSRLIIDLFAAVGGFLGKRTFNNNLHVSILCFHKKTVYFDY
jgi:hypothetical protein